MSEINHEFWDDIFKRQVYKNVDKDTLLKLIVYVKDMKKYLSEIKKEFEKIYTNFEAGIYIKLQKPKEKGVQQNAACSSTATQQTTEYAKAEENDILDQIKKELEESLKMMKSKEQQTTDSSSSEIDDEKSELTRDNKHLLFVEIMHQDEIRIIGELIAYYVERPMKENMWYFKVLERCLQKIDLLDNMLELEDKVLNLKLMREQERMTRKVKTIGVEMSNMSSKIDEEKSRLMIDNEYLQFVGTTRLKEIKMIFDQLYIYRNRYMPSPDLETHRDLIISKIEMMKSILKKKVINFDIQIEIKDIKPEDIEAFDVSSKVENVENTLIINNKYLLQIMITYQKNINSVYDQLQIYCHKYNKTNDNENIVAHSNVGTDETEKTNILRKIKKNKLRKSNKEYQTVRKLQQDEFIEICDGLIMYNVKDEMPKINLTFLTHTEPYDPTKMYDKENQLKKDNEYLAFLSMVHLEKIKEICVFFQSCQRRFNNKLENIATDENFMSQNKYVNDEVLKICNRILDLKEELKLIKNVLNNTS